MNQTVISYLETMFSTYPQTPRMLEAKAELHTMMEDAYNGFLAEGLSENEAVGRVITEFGNIDEVAPALGIANDISPTAVPASDAIPQAAVYPAITLDEAKGLESTYRRTSIRLGLAVALIVIAPITLIVLTTAASKGEINLSENVASLIGLGALFVLVAIGVLMLVSRAREINSHRRITEGHFSLTPEVSAWATTVETETEATRGRALLFALPFSVLSPVPLLVLSLLVEGSAQDFWSTVGVGILLIMVAVGLLIHLPTAWGRTLVETIREGGSPSARERANEKHSLIGVIAPIYWPLTVAIFLAWSFIGNAWDRSWVIWPIAGVLFGAIAGGITAWESRERERQRQ